MSDSEPEFSDIIADKAFIITMVTAVLFIGSTFLFVIL